MTRSNVFNKMQTRCSPNFRHDTSPAHPRQGETRTHSHNTLGATHPPATPTARTHTRNTGGTPPAHPWQGKPEHTPKRHWAPHTRCAPEKHPARHTPAHPCGRPPAADSWHTRSRLEAYPQHTWSTLRHTHSTPLRHTTRKTRGTPHTSPAHPGTPAAHPRNTRGTNVAGETRTRKTPGAAPRRTGVADPPRTRQIRGTLAADSRHTRSTFLRHARGTPAAPPRHIPGTPVAGGNPNTLPQHTGRHTPAADTHSTHTHEEHPRHPPGTPVAGETPGAAHPGAPVWQTPHTRGKFVAQSKQTRGIPATHLEHTEAHPQHTSAAHNEENPPHPRHITPRHTRGTPAEHPWNKHGRGKPEHTPTRQ